LTSHNAPANLIKSSKKIYDDTSSTTLAKHTNNHDHIIDDIFKSENTLVTSKNTITGMLVLLLSICSSISAPADAAEFPPAGKPWPDGEWTALTFSGAGLHLLVGGFFVGLGAIILANSPSCSGEGCADAIAPAGAFAIGGAVVVAPFVSAETIYSRAKRRGYEGGYWPTYCGGVMGAALGTGVVAGIAFGSENFEGSLVAGILGIPLLSAAGSVVGFHLSRDYSAERARMAKPRASPRGALLDYSSDHSVIWSAPNIAPVSYTHLTLPTICSV